MRVGNTAVSVGVEKSSPFDRNLIHTALGDELDKVDEGEGVFKEPHFLTQSAG